MADTLTITDNRTGKQYEIPITDGTIRAMDLRQIKVDPDDFGLMSNDPAFLNTASCRSAITFIDGGKGILRYRGYPIEQLAEQGTFIETAYLLLDGNLPTETELVTWREDVSHHVMLHENIKKFMEGFGTTPIPWGSSSAASAPSRRSTQTPRRSTTRPLGADKRSDSLRRCRASPPTRTATASVSRTCIRMVRRTNVCKLKRAES